mmetsp:Transcript_16189/g.49173  ORF Transcript_16189/g.49173 Transcript_16189/m.49173 type:complete len:209 (-) Transcript_16189:1626-2252(-)
MLRTRRADGRRCFGADQGQRTREGFAVEAKGHARKYLGRVSVAASEINVLFAPSCKCGRLEVQDDGDTSWYHVRYTGMRATRSICTAEVVRPVGAQPRCREQAERLPISVGAVLGRMVAEDTGLSERIGAGWRREQRLDVLEVKIWSRRVSSCKLVHESGRASCAVDELVVIYVKQMGEASCTRRRNGLRNVRGLAVHLLKVISLIGA